MKVAIVTGAAKPDSIGYEVAQRLLKEGMQVVVADLYEEGFPGLKKCFCVRCDVSDPASAEQAIQKAIEKFNRLDVLVNCGELGITRKTCSPHRRSGSAASPTARSTIGARSSPPTSTRSSTARARPRRT